jgi:hypothetical protein
MVKVNYSWINTELIKLERITSNIKPWSLFLPTNDIYEKLATGDTCELQNVVDLMSNHLKLSHIPIAKYDWSLKIPFHAIGQIKNSGTEVSVISIPFSSVGKPYAIGAILAHEMSHQILALSKMYYPNLDENEKLTDLASIAIGFGKLVLNGLAIEASGVEGMSVNLGYIGNDVKLFSYLTTCSKHKINLSDTYSYLTKDVVSLLEKFPFNNHGLLQRILRRFSFTVRKK